MKDSSHRAYYIIGEAKNGSSTELLLHSAHNEGYSPYTLAIGELSTKAYYKLRQPTRENVQKPLTPEEMARLFDVKTNRFKLGDDYHPKDVMAATWDDSGPGGGAILDWITRAIDGMPTITQKQDLSNVVYPEVLNRFKVANNLSYLALAFGKEAAMSQVISSYLPSPKTDDSHSAFHPR